MSRVSTALLRKLPSEHQYEKLYAINGFEHLLVKAYFDEPDYGRPKQYGWFILDTRFTALDKYRRGFVIYCATFAEVRGWVKARGAGLWDPEKRKVDKEWEPIPDGWTREEAGSEVPRRADPGVRDASGMGRGLRRRREVRPGSGGSDLGGDHDDRRETDHAVGLTPKKYAVVPGWIRSETDGDRHFIGFGALTWLYGVRPSECIQISEEVEKGQEPESMKDLIWLYPQRHAEGYDSMKQELAKGPEAFRLVEPS